MRPGILVRATSLALAAMSFATRSDAGNRFVSMPRDYQSTPAVTYAGMSGADCMTELEHRRVAYLTTAPVPGVDAPVRLAGPLHGVTFQQENRSTDEALNADGGIMDCRLALALDDFSELLAARGIASVGFISAYRRDTTGKIPAGQRHPSGLAIDIATFRHGDGTAWEVERDFHGRVGAKTCGRGAQNPGPRDAPSLGLRRLVCDAGATRVFNLVLTPNYDTEHHNHVHLEVRRDIRWFLVQ
jgi:hypothetical protein